MQDYLFVIKDGEGDHVEFEYDPKDDSKNIKASITDIDGETSVYVNICLADARALKNFMALLVDAMTTIELTQELNND